MGGRGVGGGGGHGLIDFMSFEFPVSYCCDIGQNNTIGKIELFSSFDLSSRDPDCKKNIQLFLQQFEKFSVYGDTN